jgi:hypothetical protein
MPKRRSTTSRMPAAKVRAFLASQTTPPQEIESLPGMRTLLLADGRALLLLPDGVGVFYESREALESLIRDSEARVAAGPVDPKQTLLPPAEEFLAHVAEHAAKLPTLLPGAEPLDGSEQSFGRVDEAVWRLRPAARMSPALVTSLVAYAGEYLRDTVNGRWSTVQSGRSLEPVVIGDDGRMYQPFAVVYLELGRGRQGSIRGALSGVLLGRKPKERS